MAALLFLLSPAWGETQGAPLVVYSFDSDGENVPPTTVAAGITASAITRVGLSASPKAGKGAFVSTGFPKKFQSGKYYEFTVTPNEGFSLTLSRLAFRAGFLGGGPTQWAVRGSTDDFQADLLRFEVTKDQKTEDRLLEFGDFFREVTQPLTIRIYGFAAKGAPGQGFIAPARDAGHTGLLVEGVVTARKD